MKDGATQTRVFEEYPVVRAVLALAVPTVVSQVILVIYNMADTFFIGQAGSDLAGMFGFGGVPLVTAETLYYLRSFAVLFLAGFVGATPLIRDTANRIYKTKVGAVLEPVLLIVLLLVCSAYLVDGSFSPFLYFRF